uniref:Uncharacterized protein n=1 Tax=Acrobeloides nanus TaxID=290746 RepID=A0A914EBR6_9BILA
MFLAILSIKTPVSSVSPAVFGGGLHLAETRAMLSLRRKDHIEAELQTNVGFDAETNSTKPAETIKFDYHLIPGVPVEKEGIRISLITQILPPDSVRRYFAKKTFYNESYTARWAGGEYTFQVVTDHLNDLHINSDPAHRSVRRFGRSYSFLYQWIWSKWYMPMVVAGVGTMALMFLICSLCPWCLMFRARPHPHQH